MELPRGGGSGKAGEKSGISRMAEEYEARLTSPGQRAEKRASPNVKVVGTPPPPRTPPRDHYSDR